MEGPPGLIHVLSLLPYFLVPSAITYIFLKQLLDYYGGIQVSTWVIIVISLCARPASFVLKTYYSAWVNKREAYAKGAVLAPYIPESGFKMVRDLVELANNGYPGFTECTPLYRNFAREHGNIFQFSIVTTNMVVTLEPDHIKAMLATQFDAFEKGLPFISPMRSLLGTGIFNSDGDMWRFHRGITRPFFTRERISDFDIYDRNCELSIKAAKNRLKEGHSIDFQDLVSRFTLDSATEFLFGHNVGSQLEDILYPPQTSGAGIHLTSNTSHSLTSGRKLGTALAQGEVLSIDRLMIGIDWPLAEMWKDKVKPCRELIDEFTEPFMREALAKRQSENLKHEVKESETEEMTLLNSLVKQTQDPKILKDELVNLLVAGRDTTMALLTFSMYMLSEHPDIAQRLRQEVFDKVGPNGRPTYDQMRDMRYMRAFLNEVLRLYPPVPVNMRVPKEPIVFQSKRPGQPPIYIPANTPVTYCVLDMHRRTDLWGPDALEFDPDRFLDARLHKYLTPNPFIFCPFNAGPRICLGQQFAYHEATFCLTRILQNFTSFALDTSLNTPPPVEWASDEGWMKAKEKVYISSHLTMYIKGGLWIKMKELGANEV